MKNLFDIKRNYWMKIVLTFITILSNFIIYAQTYDIELKKEYGVSNFDDIDKIIQTSEGDFVFSRLSSSKNESISQNIDTYGCRLVKIDSIGTIEWEKNYSDFSIDVITQLEQVDNDGYILGGHSTSNNNHLSNNNSNGNIRIVKIEENGIIEWEKNYDGTNYDDLSQILQTNDDGYLLAGHYSSSYDEEISNKQENEDYWVMKVDSRGTIEWKKDYSGIGFEEVQIIEPIGNVSYIIGGRSDTYDRTASNNDDDDIPVIVIEDVILIKDTISELNRKEEMEWNSSFNSFAQKIIAQQPINYTYKSKSFTTDFEMPDAFTPNYDGRNDIFSPVLFDGEIIEFKVYNKWGVMIHNNPKSGWNGKFNEKDQPSDVYNYFIKVSNGTEEITKYGIVTLIY